MEAVEQRLERRPRVTPGTAIEEIKAEGRNQCGNIKNENKVIVLHPSS
jgi:hypothetical protein